MHFCPHCHVCLGNDCWDLDCPVCDGFLYETEEYLEDEE